MKTFKLFMLLFLGSISTLFAQNNEIQGVLKLPTIGATAPATPNGKVLSLDNNNNVIVTTAATGGGVNNNVFTIKSINSPSSLGADITVDNTNTFLNIAINTAISNGYKKIYIQEGVYQVSESINLAGKSGIIIEGAGFETVIRPRNGFTTTNPIFSLGVTSGTSFSERNQLYNFSIDLKTPNNSSTIATGIQILGKAQRNIFNQLYFRDTNNSGGYTTAASPILIKLTGTVNAAGLRSGDESDFNTFSNIQFYRYNYAIKFESSGLFNGNIFENILIDDFITAIDFGSSVAEFKQNKFNNIRVNANTSSQYVINNIQGDRNTFSNINVFDWKASGSNIYIFNITANSKETTIENSLCRITGVLNGSEPKFSNLYYNDLGRGTKFINMDNPGGNIGSTENLLKGVHNFQVYGQEDNGDINDPTKRNEVAFQNFNTVRFNRNLFFTSPENTGNWDGFTINGFHNTLIQGGNFQYRPIVGQNPTNGNAGDWVLSNTNAWGGIEWRRASNLPNIYTNNGWLQGSRTITMQNAGTNHNLRFNRSDSQSNMASGASDVLFLNSARQAVAIGPNGLNNINARGTNYRLIVNGRAVVRDECLITGAGWADYVFAPEYKLKSLEEVEKFIKENGHLPNVPSEKTITEEGLPLAEITKIQQEKIEELTLYIIEQNKKIKELENMKNEISELKELVSKIKKE